MVLQCLMKDDINKNIMWYITMICPKIILPATHCNLKRKFYVFHFEFRYKFWKFH